MALYCLCGSLATMEATRPEANSGLDFARQGRALIPILVGIAGLFVWWGWKQGAYFDGVFYPGAIVVFALLALLLAAAPLRARPGGPALVALASLTALAIWTLLSILWSPTQAFAPADAQRAFLYAGCFLLGFWACTMLGPRFVLALAPVAIAGALVGVATLIELMGGTDVDSYLHSDATLRFPIGYRNANATFFLICAWPLLALATVARSAWPLRALAVGSATMLVELAVLSQSRGSLPAAAGALLVYLVLSPNRLRAAAYLALALIPVLAALPALLDVYQHATADQAIVPVLHDAALAIVLTSSLSVVLAAVVGRAVEPRVRLSLSTRSWLARGLAAVTVAVVAIGGTVFVAERGGPVSFLNQRVDEFKRGGNPDLSTVGARFGVNAGSNRGDFWRVALDQGQDHPLLGGGAGAFQVYYLQHRDSPETPQDPHSAGMLMLSELGLPGLGMLAAFVTAAALAGMRSRRRGPLAAALVAGGLAAGADWIFHSSYDWFWHFPALTASAIYMIGASAAPAVFDPKADLAIVPRRIALGFLALLAVVAIPLYLSNRYSAKALDEWQFDAPAAYRDLDRAASLNPFDNQPLLSKGVIAKRLGDHRLALSAFRDAAERQPDSYAVHYFIARELAGRDPAGAAAELSVARRLNPRGAAARRFARRLAR